MAFLIGSSDTSSFSTGTTNVKNLAGNYSWFMNSGLVASASGTAQNLHLYISSWDVSLNSVKAALYDSSRNLLETVTIPSSVGTGAVSVALAGTTSITSSSTYYLSLLTESNHDLLLHYKSGDNQYFHSSGTFASPADPLPTGSNASLNEWYWAVDDVGGATFGIDSTDASMQRDTSFDVTFSNPATTPTTGNTSLSNGGDTLTCSAVTGSDPYTATFTVGDLTKQVDATGYDWTLTVDAETDTTGNIPLVIQAGWTKTDLVDPALDESGLANGYTDDAPVTGDDGEHIVVSSLDSGVSFSVDAAWVWTITEAVEGDWVTPITVNRRVVQADGTIGTTAAIVFDPSLGGDNMVNGVMRGIMSSIMRNITR